MIKRIVVLLLMVGFIPSAHAGDINLGCENLARTMVKRLASEGLLLEEKNSEQRAVDIALSSCMTAESSAQHQLKESKKSWLKNWLLEDTGGKPGNKRLKNLKR